MNFELPKLPYSAVALEPFISVKTIDFHYGKHHQTYVNNLNNLVVGTRYENMSLDDIVVDSEGPIFNNAAQVWNHSFYWDSLSPLKNDQPQGDLLLAINMTFGSFDNFKEQFSKAASTLFGSGWAWLVKRSDGKLEILQEANAGNPMKRGLMPILTCDVWEHAYYLDYQNRRLDYINAYWHVVDWEIVGKRF